MEENKHDQQEEKTGYNLEIINLLKTFLDGTNLKEILDSFNSGKSDLYNLEGKKSDNNLSLWNKKFIKEVSLTALVLITIFILAFYDKIDGSTLGTLLGSVIGYSIGNSNSKRN